MGKSLHFSHWWEGGGADVKIYWDWARREVLLGVRVDALYEFTGNFFEDDVKPIERQVVLYLLVGRVTVCWGLDKSWGPF